MKIVTYLVNDSNTYIGKFNYLINNYIKSLTIKNKTITIKLKIKIKNYNNARKGLIK